MSRRFKGTAIQLDAPERLLPTESTGLDLREARSMNRPGRDFGSDRPRFDDGPRRSFRDDEAPRRRFGEDEGPRRRFGDDDGPRRSFRDEDGPRRSFRDDDGPRRSFRDEEGPRRTFSRRTEDSGSAPAAESDDDWRSGPSRTTTAPRRFESSEDRRAPRREEREDTAADLEDDWRAGSANRPSAFVSRDRPRRDEGEDGAPVRRFQSRRVEESRADDEDWRRKPERTEDESTAQSFRGVDRTRSNRTAAPVVSKIDEDDDWRTVKPSISASSFGRRTERSADSTPHKVPREMDEPRRAATPTTVQPKRETVVSTPAKDESLDMDKVAKFAGKLGEYVHASSMENMEKKVESLVKKIPVNFGKAELSTLEPMKAVLALILQKDSMSTESDIERLVNLIAPVVICLEGQYVEFGGKATEFGLNVLEEVQRFVASIGSPRLSPETALVEQIWIALYESQTVCEEIFSMYIEDETMESPAKSTTMFQTEAFRAWLYDIELPGVEATKKAAPEPEKDEWSSSDESDIEALVPKRFAAGSLHVRPGAVAPLRR